MKIEKCALEQFQKNVTISHNSTLHYDNVKSYVDIPENFIKRNADFNLYWIINNTKVDVSNDSRFNATLVDTNGNNIADRMEWIVPQLSEQEFIIEGIIRITTALHLDENRNFIEDVFPQVSSRDKIYTNPIPVNHYIRVI